MVSRCLDTKVRRVFDAQFNDVCGGSCANDHCCWRDFSVNHLVVVIPIPEKLGQFCCSRGHKHSLPVLPNCLLIGQRLPKTTSWGVLICACVFFPFSDQRGRGSLLWSDLAEKLRWRKSHACSRILIHPVARPVLNGKCQIRLRISAVKRFSSFCPMRNGLMVCLIQDQWNVGN